MSEDEIQAEIERVSMAQLKSKQNRDLPRKGRATVPVIEAQRRSNSVMGAHGVMLAKNPMHKRLAPVAHAVHGAVHLSAHQQIEAEAMQLFGNKMKLPAGQRSSSTVAASSLPSQNGASGGGASSTPAAAASSEVAFLKKEIEDHSKREESQLETMAYFEKQVKGLESQRAQQEEELLLWRMQFAELEAAGALKSINAGEGSLWASLAALEATPN